MTQTRHLVDAKTPAMRKLLRRVAARQLTPEDAVDIMLDWPPHVPTAAVAAPLADPTPRDVPEDA